MTLTPTLPTFAAPTDTERATLAAILNDTGLRATNPRINVLHYLNATDTPVTAEMISRCVDLPLSTRTGRSRRWKSHTSQGALSDAETLLAGSDLHRIHRNIARPAGRVFTANTPDRLIHKHRKDDRT